MNIKKTILMSLLLVGMCWATVNDNYIPQHYIGNGSTVDFAFPWPITDTSDVEVIIRTIATEADDVLDETTDYSVSAINNDYSSGGTVTTVATYESTSQITIRRDTPLTQNTGLVVSGSNVLREDSLEDAYDKLTLLIQELQEIIGRCLKIPKTETNSVDLVSITNRADKNITFGAEGDVTVTSVLSTGTANISAYGETLIDDGDALEARGTLGLDTDDDVEFAAITGTTIAGTTGTLTDLITKGPWFDIRAYLPSGFVIDGSIDYSTQIQAAIDAAEAAGTDSVLFIPSGTFLVEDLGIEGSMKIRGSGTLKHVSPSSKSLLKCNDTDEDGCTVDIDGITFDGNGVARQAAAEAWVSTRADVYSTVATVFLKINNCVFKNMRDKAVRMSGPLRLTNNRFDSGQPHDGTRATFYIYGVPFGADQPEGSRILIQSNTFVGWDVTTPNNYYKNPGGVFITRGTDDAGDPAYYNSLVISGNTFEGCGMSSAAVNINGAIHIYDGAEKIVISDNVIRKYSYAGIGAQAVDKCTITGNVMSDGFTAAAGPTVPNQSWGIFVDEKPRAMTDERYDVIVSDNVINGATYIGISMDCDNGIVSNNIVRDVVQDALGVGIYINGINHIIEGNVVVEAEQHAIRVNTGSSNIQISNNLLNNTTYAGGVGIFFSGVDKISITGNHIQRNGGSGVQTLGLSDIVYIENNSIDAANFGIDIRETDGANTDIVVGQNTFTNSAAGDINHAATSGVTYNSIFTNVVNLTNTNIKALAGTPIELVAAQGAGTLIEFISATLFLDYGSNVLAEPSPPDDLAIEYDDGTGQQIITWDTTGFIENNADCIEIVNAASVGGGAAAVTAAANVNKNIAILNLSGDYTGNAGNDTVIRIIVKYRVHADLGL